LEQNSPAEFISSVLAEALRLPSHFCLLPFSESRMHPFRPMIPAGSEERAATCPGAPFFPEILSPSGNMQCQARGIR